MNNRYQSSLLTLGHICTDINQGALPAMLPFLIISYDLSYASAASLVLASNIISSVIQPLFGYFGDKANCPWFMALGVLLAGAGMTMMGLVDSYWLLFLCAMITGVGVALFHPEGGRMANVVAGQHKGAGISNFAVGGNIGFAVGPLIIASVMPIWGIRGSVVMAIPAVIVAILLLRQNGTFKHLCVVEAERKKSNGESLLTDDWGGFLRVTALNFARSIVVSGLIVFIPLYWAHVLMQPEGISSLILTLYAGSGAIATLFGGRIADRVGFKKMIVTCLAVFTPALALFVITSNVFLAALLIVIVSLSASASYSSIIALSQQYLPNRVGLASGISMGVVVSVGGITSPIIGAVGDSYGLTASMAVLAAVAFIALIFGVILFLVKDKPRLLSAAENQQPENEAIYPASIACASSESPTMKGASSEVHPAKVLATETEEN
ncbi:MAG: MFS transporter, partial [Coriobacteriaceae bacterium]|nr:MFS transporter [Coriobacteriaceae bacterium]